MLLKLRKKYFEPGKNFCFEIFNLADGKSTTLLLQADSAADAQEWVASLTKCFAAHKQSKILPHDYTEREKSEDTEETAAIEESAPVSGLIYFARNVTFSLAYLICTIL